MEARINKELALMMRDPTPGITVEMQGNDKSTNCVPFPWVVLLGIRVFLPCFVALLSGLSSRSLVV